MNFLNLFENDIIIVLPEIFFSICILILILFGAFYTTSYVYNFPYINRSILWLSILSLFFVCLLFLNSPFIFEVGLNNTFIHDYLSNKVKIIITVATICSLLIGQDYLKKHRIDAYEYFILLLLSIFGMFY